MRVLVLMNSAVMVGDGKWERRTISRGEFVDLLRRADRLISYVGYQATADHIHRISGRSIPISRDESRMRPGDTALVCKLRYRLDSPARKGKNWTPHENDFEYLLVRWLE